jgi:hypothetical protein
MDDRDGALQAVEDAYRAALAGTAPGLLKKATEYGFRLFVEGMFDLLTGSLNGCSDRGSATFSRQDVLEIIAGLILNAASHAKEPARWRRGAHGIRLWATLIRIIPEYVGTMLKKTTVRWPGALRRRFPGARGRKATFVPSGVVAEGPSRPSPRPPERSVKWLADECFDNDIIRGLLRRSPDFDLVRARDISEVAGRDDEALLAWAAKHERVVLTHDLATMVPALRQGQPAFTAIVVVPDSLNRSGNRGGSAARPVFEGVRLDCGRHLPTAAVDSEPQASLQGALCAVCAGGGKYVVDVSRPKHIEGLIVGRGGILACEEHKFCRFCCRRRGARVGLVHWRYGDAVLDAQSSVPRSVVSGTKSSSWR